MKKTNLSFIFSLLLVNNVLANTNLVDAIKKADEVESNINKYEKNINLQVLNSSVISALELKKTNEKIFNLEKNINLIQLNIKR